MMSRFFKILTNGLLIMVGALTLFSILPLLNLPGDWYQLLVVKSASMEPTLPVGSVAVYRPHANYEPDEIIVYQYEQAGETKLVVHRLLKKITNVENEVSYVTQGDANQEAPPQTVNAEQVRGKLVAVIPQMGYVIGFLKSQLGSALIILCLLILVLVGFWSKSGE